MITDHHESLVPKCRSTVSGRLGISKLPKELKTDPLDLSHGDPEPADVGEIQESAFTQSSSGLLMDSQNVEVGPKESKHIGASLLLIR